MREGRLDHHSFALVFEDSSIKTWPEAASLAGPMYFWKHQKEQGDNVDGRLPFRLLALCMLEASLTQAPPASDEEL